MTLELPDTLAVLEWDTVLERIAQLAGTRMGRRMVLLSRPMSDRVWLFEIQAAVRECLVWIDAGLPTAHGAEPLDDMVERMNKGGVLSLADFVALLKTLSVFQRLDEVADVERFPHIAERIGGTVLPHGLIESLNQVIDAEGQIRDQASPELADIRRRMRQLEREIDDVFERVLRSAEWSRYLQDGIITVRFGRRVVPVRNEFRHSVPGIVHDQSGSGQTVFVEPLAVVERQNRLTTLRQDEAREIERILAALTAKASQVAPTLSAIHDHLAWFDRQMAAAQYGRLVDGTLPELGGHTLVIQEARHPLLENPVPISLELSRERPAIIITGPNTGGKTVALKTTGIIVLLALSGFMAPVQEGTRIPLYRQIFADIGDEQSLSQNLSTFSSHLVRLGPMMRQAGPDTLSLIDEIGAGTDPEEGAALAEAMIQHLVDKQSPVIASTHYSRLKLLGLKDPRIQNALVEFDRETLAPTYHLVLGSPGSSHAFYIARRLGFPPELVDRAESLLDREAVTLSDAILEINQLQRTLREQDEALRARQADLDVRQRALDDKERILTERLERDRERAEKAWRRELDDMTQKFNQALEAVRQQEGKERARAVEALREQYRGIAKLPRSIARRQAQAGTPPDAVGDRVRVAGFPDVGTIVELKGRTATVEVGSLKLKLAVDELERIEGGVRPAAARTGSPPS
ncbi:endonuclease MutS2 [Sulfobacillus harzensis]|uniref:Endonuclease MutS2 n=1 Tax=Sulfobacillus harzensis TaxID=2729629 RepID=A0A7Y0Q1R5_9FIRM|nr:MutS2/Smr-associated SH3 domain-containing protein [Sulfobacillus harzensis]NMP22368.1 endonuclease MutS2 [Sulfobacillus harzensis]